MRTVRVMYHEEGDSWWAESPDAEGFTAAAESFRDVRELVQEAMELYFPDESLRIVPLAPPLPFLVAAPDFGGNLVGSNVETVHGFDSVQAVA